MDLKQAQRILMANFLLMLAIALVLVVLYECDLLVPTELSADVELVFCLQVFMELCSILVIPIALKLFSFKAVRRRLVEGKGAALLPWGTARINMLCLPMLINVFLYYQTMAPTFGYMGIILLLCLFFVYPSMDRCYAETDVRESSEEK